MDFIRTPVVPEILKAKVSVFVDLFKKTEQVKRQAEQVRLLQEREHESRMAEAADRLDAEAKRNRFFTLALDMLGIADFTGTLRQVNPSWGKTLGYTDEELKSRSFLEYVHPDDRACTEAQLESLTHGNAVPYFETRFATRAGGYRWLAWTAAPYTEEGLLYIYARDLTETRRAEEERVKLIREQTRPRGGRGLGAPRRLPGRGGHRPDRVARLRGDAGQAGPPRRAHARATGPSSTWRRRAAASTASRSRTRPAGGRALAEALRRRCRRWRAAAPVGGAALRRSRCWSRKPSAARPGGARSSGTPWRPSARAR